MHRVNEEGEEMGRGRTRRRRRRREGLKEEVR
jgi:hypothetical protein